MTLLMASMPLPAPQSRGKWKRHLRVQQDTVEDFAGQDILLIENRANRMKDLDFMDTKKGVLVRFGRVGIFLTGLDRDDIDRSDFDFG